jgi:DNA-binding GntR family transcriptional regulator
MSAADDAYDYAKERILDGRFKAGEMVSEGDVAGPTGLSRTPVREAFLRLEIEGLLRLFPKRGALVVTVSPAEVESVMETRLLIELHAVDRAVEHRGEVSGLLEVAIATQRRLVAGKERSAFVESDREFHRILVAATGNSILLDLHDSMRDRQTRMGLAAISRQAGRVDTILREHEEIAKAIGAGDRPRAEAALRKHLEGTLLLLRAAR